MSHLSIETLARLIDEPPDTAEAAHLDLCALCQAELEGLKADASSLAALPQLDPPSAQWYALEQRLVAEGLLRKTVQRSFPAWAKYGLQAAAAIAIFVIGNLTAPLFFDRTERMANRDGDPGPSISTPSLIERLPQTRDEAESFVRNSERTYLDALTRYAELDSNTRTTDLVAQVAALESIVLTTRAALGQAPADPVINGYHLTALAQRDAAMKKLAATRGQTWF